LDGYPVDEDKPRTLFGKLKQKQATENFVATRLPELHAAVPSYGNQAPTEDAAMTSVTIPATHLLQASCPQGFPASS
jgi:hypothetical protein